MQKKLLLLFCLVSLLKTLTIAQTAQFPIVQGFGGIYEIPEATERPDPNGNYKIIIDLVSASDDPKQINRMVDNIARMINLHGIGGVPRENIKVKVAVHGGAIFTILNDSYYEKLYGTKNPNLQVYEALKDAGVEFYICGQSLIAREMKTTDVWDGAEIALSMLTTLTTYVPQGYMLMRF
ncbi:DsrE family protein [Aquiflexum lacus]|uniref:DsrE family protein n=1 Tax=Aquiflexum lacus TaxID=2483805 RepID=UPI0018957513|nr:DsrE family protein [Aquiflexum lacus]